MMIAMDRCCANGAAIYIELLSLMMCVYVFCVRMRSRDADLLCMRSSVSSTVLPQSLWRVFVAPL